MWYPFHPALCCWISGIINIEQFFIRRLFLPIAKPALTRRDSCTDNHWRTYQASYEGIKDVQRNGWLLWPWSTEFQITRRSLVYMQVLPDILKFSSNIYLTWIYMYFQVGKKYLLLGTFHIMKDLSLVYRLCSSLCLGIFVSIGSFEN